MENFNFKDHTTIKLGGAARSYINCTSMTEAIELSAFLEESKTRSLVFGGGSNLLVGDEGFAGTAIQLSIKKREMNFDGDCCRFIVGAGEDFDSVVEEAVSEDWSGLELLSGIPGWAGASPIQNIGAFGGEVGNVIDKVHCLDTKTGDIIELSRDECLFSYRSSIFNTNHKNRYWILYVEFILKRVDEIFLSYPDLAERLDAKKVREVLPIRDTILSLRKERGMIVGEGMPNSVGSFFKNPIITAEEMKHLQASYPGGVPCYPLGEKYKVPAAWLIGKTKFKKGYQHRGVGISDFHNLCLVNLGDGTFKELMELALLIKASVKEKFFIELDIEPEIYT